MFDRIELSLHDFNECWTVKPSILIQYLCIYSEHGIKNWIGLDYFNMLAIFFKKKSGQDEK